MKELKLSLLIQALKKVKNVNRLYINKIDSGYKVEGKNKEFFESINTKLDQLEGEING